MDKWFTQRPGLQQVESEHLDYPHRVTRVTQAHHVSWAVYEHAHGGASIWLHAGTRCFRLSVSEPKLAAWLDAVIVQPEQSPEGWVCRRCSDQECNGCVDPLENLPPETAEWPCGEILECVCGEPLGWSFGEVRREVRP
jgi:hypothetical protein